MSMVNSTVSGQRFVWSFLNWGMFWLLVAIVGAGLFFSDGLDALVTAWQLPEYSHGPLIPVLSLLLFLRQLKHEPIHTGAVRNRWPGVLVVALALAFAALGRLSNISEIVAYATILWVGGILLISFGWAQGKHFWPPVLHLVYMLPLPDVLYYKLSTTLQLISSELGVWMLQMLNVPVFLDGNIIDLGVMKLHVAEACSGLRYLFPILSFSYVFAVLYRGPMWHKAVLLLAAVPITVLMNSVRIAIGGLIANIYGIEWLEGFTHFFEGWVIFLACVLLLFGLARIMLMFLPVKMSLTEALDLETSGLATQAARIRLIQPSGALITAAVLICGSVLAWQMVPDNRGVTVSREQFSSFPRVIGDWQQYGEPEVLEPATVKRLQADDYRSVNFVRTATEPAVGLFMAWYRDQSKGGVHSPEICLPSSGWEIAWLERSDITKEMGTSTRFLINRAIIQKGETRMMVYYWFQQRDRRIAWDFAAKLYLLLDGITTGSTSGAIVRLTTSIPPGETDAHAETRLNGMLQDLMAPLPRFIPDK